MSVPSGDGLVCAAWIGLVVAQSACPDDNLHTRAGTGAPASRHADLPVSSIVWETSALISRTARVRGTAMLGPCLHPRALEHRGPTRPGMSRLITTGTCTFQQPWLLHPARTLFLYSATMFHSTMTFHSTKAFCSTMMFFTLQQCSLFYSVLFYNNVLYSTMSLSAT